MPSAKCLFVLLLSLSCAYGEKRSLSSEVNPDCKAADNCKGSTLVHVQSVGTDSTYHYLWSFVRGYAPAILTFETDNKAQLQVDWKKISGNDNSNVFTFSKGSTVYNSFAVEISHLYFKNTTGTKPLYTVPLEETEWTATPKTSTDDNVLYNFDSIENSKLNGSISISLGAHSQAGRSEIIPRLQFTQSSNLFETTLKKIYFPVDTEYDKSQLVANLTFVMGGKDVANDLHEHVSIDDEYTPGVFQRFIYSLLSKEKTSKSNNESAYVEWKPVAYIDNSLTIAKSIKVTNPALDKQVTLPSKSLLNAYYAGSSYDASALKGFVFGDPDDDFNYQDNSYLQFSMAFGLNTVPEEALSLTLKIVILVGLGLPMILFVVSIIYTIYIKVRKSNNDFSTLSEDN